MNKLLKAALGLSLVGTLNTVNAQDAQALAGNTTVTEPVKTEIAGTSEVVSWRNKFKDDCVSIDNPHPSNPTQKKVTEVIDTTRKSDLGRAIINQSKGKDYLVCDVTKVLPGSDITSGFVVQENMAILNPGKRSAAVDLPYTLSIANTAEKSIPVTDYASAVMTQIATQADATSKAAVVSNQLGKAGIDSRMSYNNISYLLVERAVSSSLNNGGSVPNALKAGFNTYVTQKDTNEYASPASVVAVNTIAEGGKKRFNSFMNDTRPDGTPGTSIDQAEFPSVISNILNAAKMPNGTSYIEQDKEAGRQFVQSTVGRLDAIRTETKKQDPVYRRKP